MSNTATIHQLDSIQGMSFLAIQGALPEFTQTKLNIVDYRLTVFAEGNSLIVTFTDRDAPLSGRGSPGKRPGYQVEMDRASLRVLNSSYMR
jgi:hypothetical protein